MIGARYLSMKFTALITAAVLWWYIGSAVANAGEPFFTGLGHLGSGEFSEANGVSADGSVVVGRGSTNPGWEAFRWTQASGMAGLGDLAGGADDSRANDVSADGSVVVGKSMISYFDPRRGKPPGSEALRWTEAGLVGLGDLPGGVFYSDALDVSADGAVVVGQGSSTPGYLYNEAFRWTQAGGIVGLGYLPGGSASRAFAVSADGSVVAGIAFTASGSEAFRWTEVDGMVGIGDLPGGYSSGWAFGISADGSVIVGRGSSASGLEAFRWTQASGMVGLGDLPGGDFVSSAVGTSADGSIVIGESNSAAGYEAFVWDAVHGMRSLREVLINDFGLGASLAGWRLTSANDISADGQFIVGSGTNPSGNGEAWMARLAPVLSGDFNFNGTVDATDYVVWRKNFSGDQAMYDAWRANFGSPLGSGSGSAIPSAASLSAAVPEPAALALAALALALLVFRSK